jgi:hypothetical protein
MIVTTLIVIVLFFVSGFGMGWCIRGDRELERQREREWRSVTANRKRVRWPQKKTKPRFVEQKDRMRWN